MTSMDPYRELPESIPLKKAESFFLKGFIKIIKYIILSPVYIFRNRYDILLKLQKTIVIIFLPISLLVHVIRRLGGQTDNVENYCSELYKQVLKGPTPTIVGFFLVIWTLTIIFSIFHILIISGVFIVKPVK